MQSPLADSSCMNVQPLYRMLQYESFHNQHAMRRFVLSLLASKEKDHTLMDITSPNGLNLLRQIISSSFSVDAGNARSTYSFQAIAVPLCIFLSHPFVERSPMESQKQKIFSTINNSNSFLSSSFGCIETILKRDGNFRDRTAVEVSQPAYSPPSFSAIVLAVVRVLNESIVRGVFQLSEDETRSILDTLERVCEFRPQIHEEEDYKHVQEFLTSTIELLRAEIDISDHHHFFRNTRDRASQLAGTCGVRALPEQTEVNCRNANIFPAPHELLQEQSPSLPKTGDLNMLHSEDSLSLQQRICRHLDTHFQLIKEDMFLTFRKAVNQFLKDPDSVLGLSSSHFDVMGPKGAEASCCVWRNVQVKNIKTSFRNGATIEVCFDSLSVHEKSALRSSCAKHLDNGSLVCLIRNLPAGRDSVVGDSSDSLKETSHSICSTELPSIENVILAVVASDQLETEDGRLISSIELKAVSSEYSAKLLAEMSAVYDGGCASGRRTCMLQVKGHFITGNLNVLQTLNVMKLPDTSWVKQIFGTCSPLGLRRTSLGSKESDPHPPSYINTGQAYDLAYLSNDPDTQQQLANVPVYDVNASIRLLSMLQPNLILDQSQIEAFMFGIGREVSLIQGPPGCGKTFIGVQIIKAIMRNRHRTKLRDCLDDMDVYSRTTFGPSSLPILCVCYTNHALDQFLEAIVKARVVSLSDVVRIGSRSQSTMLADRQLNKVAKEVSKRKGRWNWNSSSAKMKNLMKQVEWLALALRSASGTLFQSYLEKHESAAYQRVMKEVSRSSSEEEDCDVDEVDFEMVITAWESAPLSVNETKSRQIQILSMRARFREFARKELQVLQNELNVLSEENKKIRALGMLNILRSAKIVGCTTSGAASRHSLLQALAPAIVIGEEAAEVLEAHLLCSLTPFSQHIILIGDHEQLLPKVAEYTLTRDSKQGHDLDVSLFERLEKQKSVPIARLTTQRRMHPKISALARLTTYPHLKDSDVVNNYPKSPLGFTDVVYFFDHNNSEESAGEMIGKSTSHMNRFEVEMLTALTRYVIVQGYQAGQIAVLTPYVAQLKAIRERFESENVTTYINEKDQLDLELANLGISDKRLHTNEINMDTDSAFLSSLNERVRLSTVDNFQGEEADIVLISTVRNNPVGSLGFLQSNNRCNVMLTRARHGMILLGSLSTAEKCKGSTPMKAVGQYLQSRGRVSGYISFRCQNHGKETFATGPDEIPRDGGCGQACDADKPCGHICSRQCHPDDDKHKQPCMESCRKIMQPCGHRCQRKCYEDCANCQVMAKDKLSCGHSGIFPCSELTKGTVKCTTVTGEGVRPRCGHKYEYQCWESGQQIRGCDEVCMKTRECDHACQNMCHVDAHIGKLDYTHKGCCMAMCGRTLRCGHQCQELCHGQNICPPCGETSDISCEHVENVQLCRNISFQCFAECEWACTCEYGTLVCDRDCWEPCDRKRCNRRCTKRLECGHQCPSVCGENCPSSQFCIVCTTGKKERCEQLMSQVIDFISMSTFGSITESEDLPIIVLPCKHVFTMKFMDAYFQIGSTPPRSPVCEAHAVQSATNLTRSSPETSSQHYWRVEPKCCICQHAIYGVRRYKSITNAERLLTQAKRLQAEQEAELSDLLVQADILSGQLLKNFTHDKYPKAAPQPRDEAQRRLTLNSCVLMEKVMTLRKEMASSKAVSAEKQVIVSSTSLNDPAVHQVHLLEVRIFLLRCLAIVATHLCSNGFDLSGDQASRGQETQDVRRYCVHSLKKLLEFCEMIYPGRPSRHLKVTIRKTIQDVQLLQRHLGDSQLRCTDQQLQESSTSLALTLTKMLQG